MSLESCLYQAPGTVAVSSDKTLRLSDTVYEPSVQSLRCYVDRGEQLLSPPVRDLHERAPLVLDFDVLESYYTPYQLYIIPCDAEWQPLNIHTASFVSGINQYLITEFSYSVATKVPYVHYRVELPEVLRAGNYVAAVHRGGNRLDLLLTTRFMIYSGDVQIQAEVNATLQSKTYSQYHRLVLEVNYGKLSSINPYTDLLVYIRQNRNWLQMRKLVRPTRGRGRNTMLYAPIYGESDFCALPSFRHFDTRRLHFRSLRISKWQQDEKGRFHAYLQPDRSRLERPHIPEEDINGSFLHSSADPVQSAGDYVEVHLRLVPREDLSVAPHVVGGFNQWQPSPSNQLRYDSSSHTYATTLHLKQGYYEYLYWLPNKGFLPLEGCWAQSENEYEVFVYHIDRYRRIQPLLGYLRISGHL